MNVDGYIDFLESMPYIQNDTATLIIVLEMLDEYLEINDNIRFPLKIETIVLQNVLQWLQFDYLDIRWHATRILFKLLRNAEYENLINQKIIDLIDNDCVYIKNLILRQIFKIKGITEKTQNYVVFKCQQDPCFVVKMVCNEVLEEQKMIDKFTN